MTRLFPILTVLLLMSCVSDIQTHNDNALAMHEELQRRNGIIFRSYAAEAKAKSLGSFIGEWIRGTPSSSGHYSERLVVNEKRYQYFEDGVVVMAGPTLVKNNMILMAPVKNESRYYRNGCWGTLRNRGNSLDLFGQHSGMLCFDRKENPEQNGRPSGLP